MYLKLENTYLYEDADDKRLFPIYYRDKEFYLPEIYVFYRTSRRYCIDSEGIDHFLKGILSTYIFFPKSTSNEL